MPLCTSVYMCLVPAGKGLTSWLSFVVSNCEFGKVWYLIVLIPDLCILTYFHIYTGAVVPFADFVSFFLNIP